MSKHIKVMTGHAQRSQACGRLRARQVGQDQHEEILRAYSAEPEKCRKGELGRRSQKLEGANPQETNMSKKHCRRS